MTGSRPQREQRTPKGREPPPPPPSSPLQSDEVDPDAPDPDDDPAFDEHFEPL